VGHSAYRRIFDVWFFISHHNCQLPSTRDAAECLQAQDPVCVSFVARTCRLAFAFAVGELSFASQWICEMKIPALVEDCQVSVRDCTARSTGDQPDELNGRVKTASTCAHLRGGVSRSGAGAGKPQPRLRMFFVSSTSPKIS
jgi:hypothetical protein